MKKISQYPTYKEFDKNPEKWWVLLEIVRNYLGKNWISLRGLDKTILYTPDYGANPYQNNLYNGCRNVGLVIKGKNKFDLETVFDALRSSNTLVWHQHWLKEIYWMAKDKKNALWKINFHFSMLKVLKCFNVKIVWTLHNLDDHDANDLQKEFGKYAIKKMAEISDIILVHTEGSIVDFKSFSGLDIRAKSKILPHAIYNVASNSEEVSSDFSSELKFKDGMKYILHLGMIRPYKGIFEVFEGFAKYIQVAVKKNIVLVIAGESYDDRLLSLYTTLSPDVKRHVVLINRRLSEDEISYCMHHAHLCINPYKKILISGSYYLNSAYKKATATNEVGMFKDLIDHSVDGFFISRFGLLEDFFNWFSSVSYEKLEQAGILANRKCSEQTWQKMADQYRGYLGV